MLAAIADAAIMLDGADRWATRRQGLASAFGARFDVEVNAFAISVFTITVVKAAAVPFWVLEIGAMRYLYLAVGWMLPATRRPLPACSPPTRARRHSEHRADLRPRLRDIPGLGCRELRVGTRPARLFMCRRHRHVAVDPAELGRARMSLVAQTGAPGIEGAR